jgi:3-deoxy-7-phosphoheptulonate synthase / chorismate mutase
MTDIHELRKTIDEINQELLTLLNKRAEVAVLIGKEKQKHGQPIFDPIREQAILTEITKKNQGPFKDEVIIHLFKEIFKASSQLQETKKEQDLKIRRKSPDQKTEINIKGEIIGGEKKTMIFGPCSIESIEQLELVANELVKRKLKFIRGGAFKPRTSPYDFQGLGLEALEMMNATAHQHDLISVVEIMDTKHLDMAFDYVDIIQVGARNMQNFSLLKELGQIKKPVILKRGFAATLEEFKMSAEYIIAGGNEQVILCERGIRTFERSTRNTLDISSVPILKAETHLPVIVDVSHAAGRKDILAPLAKASLAAGCDGIMTEIHPNPKIALSDAMQQLDFNEFNAFFEEINRF